MDTKLQLFANFLKRKDIDCVELEATIHAADGVDLSRVLWSLAYLRHTRDLELYKSDMPDACQQAIQRVADLCAIQAHTDVAPITWGLVQVTTEAAGQRSWEPAARVSLRSTRATTEHGAASARAATYSAEWSAAAASVTYPSTYSVAQTAHYMWERDTLIELVIGLTYK